MLFSWIIKQIFKVEPEPGQSDGSGSSQIPRLRLRNPVFYPIKAKNKYNLIIYLLFPFFPWIPIRNK